jgi:DNA-binding MarR family transcriptional regulator
MSDQRQQLFETLMKFDKTLLRMRGRILSSFGLTTSQAEILLLSLETPRINQLAETLAITSSAATQLVESIEDKGLVKRRRAIDDKRAVEVHLTRSGKKLIKQIEATKKKFATELLDTLDEEEVCTVLIMHRKIIANISKRFGC